MLVDARFVIVICVRLCTVINCVRRPGRICPAAPCNVMPFQSPHAGACGPVGPHADRSYYSIFGFRVSGFAVFLSRFTLLYFLFFHFSFFDSREIGSRRVKAGHRSKAGQPCARAPNTYESARAHRAVFHTELLSPLYSSQYLYVVVGSSDTRSERMYIQLYTEHCMNSF